jgi:hypothetical protein
MRLALAVFHWPSISGQATLSAMAIDEIVPDDKNWTWVLERPCTECGFDASSIDPADVSEMIRANALAFVERLGRGSGVRSRPAPGVWSPLEYGAHVRDVYRLFGERLRSMLDEDDPLFENWNQDHTAIAQRYAESDPAAVAAELSDAATAIADAFGTVDGEQWDRPGRRSDGASYTVASFAKYLIHDPIHHLWDVDQAFAAT